MSDQDQLFFGAKCLALRNTLMFRSCHKILTPPHKKKQPKSTKTHQFPLYYLLVRADPAGWRTRFGLSGTPIQSVCRLDQIWGGVSIL